MLKIQITAKLYDKIIVLKSGCLIKHKWLKLEKITDKIIIKLFKSVDKCIVYN